MRGVIGRELERGSQLEAVLHFVIAFLDPPDRYRRNINHGEPVITLTLELSGG